jgi:hypothetical protein
MRCFRSFSLFVLFEVLTVLSCKITSTHHHDLIAAGLGGRGLCSAFRAFKPCCSICVLRFDGSCMFRSGPPAPAKQSHLESFVFVPSFQFCSIRFLHRDPVHCFVNESILDSCCCQRILMRLKKDGACEAEGLAEQSRLLTLHHSRSEWLAVGWSY